MPGLVLSGVILLVYLVLTPILPHDVLRRNGVPGYELLPLTTTLPVGFEASRWTNLFLGRRALRKAEREKRRDPSPN
jgi:hypothetical protein